MRQSRKRPNGLHVGRSARTFTVVALGALGAMAGASGLTAQDLTGADKPPAAEARQEVLDVITRLFDGMRANSSEMVASVFAGEAVMITTEGRDGSPSHAVRAAGGFINAVGQGTTAWDEPYWDAVVRIHDHLAIAWVKYAFYLGTEFSHCGVDAFILGRVEGEWKITALADTRQTDDCGLLPGPTPPEQ